jgi:hypothetical protein
VANKKVEPIREGVGSIEIHERDGPRLDFASLQS